MVAASENRPSKTDFLKEFLQRNPKANPKIVNEAWELAGHDGAISGTLVHKIRAELGLAGNLRARSKSSTRGRVPAATSTATTTVRRRGPRPGAKAAAAAAAAALERSNGTHEAATTERAAPSRERDRLLQEVEGEIDSLIFKLMGVGGLEEVENALRRVRRIVVRSHEA